MTFFWWNDAVRFANELAAGTHVRHRVFAWQGGWIVEPVLEVVYGVGR